MILLAKQSNFKSLCWCWVHNNTTDQKETTHTKTHWHLYMYMYIMYLWFLYLYGWICIIHATCSNKHQFYLCHFLGRNVIHEAPFLLFMKHINPVIFLGMSPQTPRETRFLSPIQVRQSESTPHPGFPLKEVKVQMFTSYGGHSGGKGCYLTLALTVLAKWPSLNPPSPPSVPL